MINWTDSGLAVLAGRAAVVHSRGLHPGRDLADVTATLRKEIETELFRMGASLADAEQIGIALTNLDRGRSGSNLPLASPKASEAISVEAGGAAIVLCSLFAILLPFTTLALELHTRMCAEFFDTIPTWFHVAAIAFVPLANFFALRELRSGVSSRKPSVWVERTNAVAIGIAAFYSLWLAAITPIAVIAIVFLGLGLLPLSPLLSLVGAVFLRIRLGRKARRAGKQIAATGVWFGLGFGGLVALEVPGVVRAWATSTAVHGVGEEKVQALAWLRRLGNESALLRASYGRDDEMRSAVYRWFAQPLSLQERRLVYYRVTGRAFNSVPAPTRVRPLAGDRSRDTEEWVWDENQGDSTVGQHLKALYLTQSRIDGVADGDAAWGYLEWTMVFRNDHEFQQREARALLQLPPGAVVSRLTLWIDGEEREAAFGGRSQVRRAYQAVVQRQRDPVLVTTKGPDRVLVQCFPVLPRGGQMKIRVGMTLPLVVTTPELAQLPLPRVIEKNYSVLPDLTHDVWVDAPQSLSSGLDIYRQERSTAGRHVIRASLSSTDLANPLAGLSVMRDSTILQAWTKNPVIADEMVVQTIARRSAPDGPLVLVIDGSQEIADAVEKIATALEQRPEGRSIQLFFGGDVVRQAPEGTFREIAAWLRQQRFVGGQDSTQVLQAAIERIPPQGGCVLWLHGSQPVSWLAHSGVEQLLARRKGQVQIFALAVNAGPNVVLEKIGEVIQPVSLPRLGVISEDVARAFDRLQSGGWVLNRKSQSDAGISADGPMASSHVARLWVADEVERLMARGQGNREAAVRLATKMQLVTSVTGAVVLETKQQYDAAGLSPVDAKTVPTVPDTGASVLLLLVVLVCLGWFARRVRGGERLPG